MKKNSLRICVSFYYLYHLCFFIISMHFAENEKLKRKPLYHFFLFLLPPPPPPPPPHPASSPPSHWGQLIQEQFPPLEGNCFFQSRRSFGSTLEVPGKRTGSHESYVSLEKRQKNMKEYPYYSYYIHTILFYFIP